MDQTQHTNTQQPVAHTAPEVNINDILAAVGEARQKAEVAQQSTEDIVNKLKQAFADDNQTPDDWFQDVLSAALEAEKQGYPIPLTLKISTELKKTQEENRKLQQLIKEMKERLEAQANPEAYVDLQAYTTMDSLIDRHLARAYNGQPPQSVKTAIINELKERIMYDKQHNPQVWAKVRQDPALMDRVVRAAISNFVPSIAKEALDEYVSEREEYDADTIYEAIKEAQALLKHKDVAKDPEKVKFIQDKIKRLREMYWEAKMSWTGGKTKI